MSFTRLTTLAVALAAALCLAAPAMAADINLMNYNAMVFGDFNAPSSDVQGSLAAGGNVSLGNYSVGDQLGSGYSGPAMVVGGNLTGTSGHVYYGDVVVGGQANVTGSFTIDGNLVQGAGSLPVDFNNAQVQLTSLSQSLAALAPTGSAYLKWGGLKVAGDGTSDLQIINIDGQQLSSVGWWHLLEGIPQDATVVFNVSGSNVSMHGDQSQLAGMSNRVLFNFYEATDLTMYNLSVEGSILAAWADINGYSGVIQGQVVGGSWTGPMQINSNPFTGYGDPGGGAATPEPGTLLLVGSAAMVAWGARRRRRRV